MQTRSYYKAIGDACNGLEKKMTKKGVICKTGVVCIFYLAFKHNVDGIVFVSKKLRFKIKQQDIIYSRFYRTAIFHHNYPCFLNREMFKQTAV